MLKEKTISFKNPVFADSCNRSGSSSSWDVEIQEFEEEILKAIEKENK
ncbi:hypothetical protein [Paenibacillus polymyxa]|nr:hypothetical protein [Paenibacillus polymyxa]